METIKVWQVESLGDCGNELSIPFATDDEANKHIACLESLGCEDITLIQHEIPIDHALKEQDKRTRHAIADAVAQHLAILEISPAAISLIDSVILNCNGGLADGHKPESDSRMDT
jgi:hypothetical protein